ncbi:MAG: SWIM zinc finger family protein [Gemmatimonadaceae bacterium]
MSFYGWGWAPHKSVAQQRLEAKREKAKLEKQGRKLMPVVVEGRAIARTFWGTAWCTNLERYSDLANRLPRGRSYVRNGLVLHLEVGPGTVEALVSGTSLYQVGIKVSPVSKARWSAICKGSSGAIDSLIELLQGRFSKAVMERVCREETGLFPALKEIEFSCSCPDWASMCKHVAAVLYGVGARLDQHPELLFTLREVKAEDLIAKADESVRLEKLGPSNRKVLADANLSELFGLQLGAADVEAPSPAKSARKATRAKPKSKRTTKRTVKRSVKPGPPQD